MLSDLNVENQHVDSIQICGLDNSTYWSKDKTEKAETEAPPKFRDLVEEKPAQKMLRRTTCDVGGNPKNGDYKETELRNCFYKEDVLVHCYWVTNHHKNRSGI